MPSINIKSKKVPRCKRDPEGFALSGELNCFKRHSFIPERKNSYSVGTFKKDSLQFTFFQDNLVVTHEALCFSSYSGCPHDIKREIVRVHPNLFSSQIIKLLLPHVSLFANGKKNAMCCCLIKKNNTVSGYFNLIYFKEKKVS